MKIWHIVQWLEMGGGESVAIDLANYQHARDDDVTVAILTPDTGPLVAKLKTRRVHLPRLRPGLDPTLWPALWARFARARPDVVHTHDPKSLVYAAPAARLAGARVVHTKHGLDIDTARRKRLVRGASRALHACVGVSAETAAIARTECAPSKVSHIANGIDVDRPRLNRSAARDALGLPLDGVVVGAIGRLEHVKGHDVLLAAATGLRATICIIGDGTLRAKLVANAPPNVRFVGLQPDAARFLHAFDVFAQPSRSEGLPLTILEAMAASVPVVASAVGEMPAVLDRAGVMVPAEDPRSLHHALAELINDARERSTLGEAGRARVESNYSLATTATAYDHVYRSQTAASRED